MYYRYKLKLELCFHSSDKSCIICLFAVGQHRFGVFSGGVS
ncbi:MAG: hypothetical protein AVDCRST_MAG96-1315 [uncultured Segetibacter sp.]|uniref:Uncharacterized protein n=1 Tax=uncultured Segetibacter sp. TaxID=481133 RepID=A0A6J4S824_9BACT|nr:MAG: hypothetical protein AVDCRST_MAG96-1315 [uncultured Segetibacter sp.]